MVPPSGVGAWLLISVAGYCLVQHHLETFLANAAEADPMGNGEPGSRSGCRNRRRLLPSRAPREAWSGSALNAHFHFHVCVIDGVFSEDAEGSVQFHEATHLTASDWDELQHTVRHRVLRYFRRHGLLERHVTDDMLTWQASGGFSIDASVYIQARDRAGLERLLRRVPTRGGWPVLPSPSNGSRPIIH